MPKRQTPSFARCLLALTSYAQRDRGPVPPLLGANPLSPLLSEARSYGVWMPSTPNVNRKLTLAHYPRTGSTFMLRKIERRGKPPSRRRRSQPPI